VCVSVCESVCVSAVLCCAVLCVAGCGLFNYCWDVEFGRQAGRQAREKRVALGLCSVWWCLVSGSISVGSCLT
jgi:hypothetical protein